VTGLYEEFEEVRRALLSFPMGSALPSCHTTGNSSFACDNPLDVGLNTYGHCTMVLCLLQLRGSTLARFRRGIWTSLPKTRPAEDHLGSKESAQSFQRAAWAGPQSRTLSIEMEGQGHRLRVELFKWLFVHAEEVAIHPGPYVLANQVAIHYWNSCHYAV